MEQVPSVPYEFDTSDVEGSVFRLARPLFGATEPAKEHIRVQTLTQGTTNALFRASYEPHPAQRLDVLIKIYGEGTDKTIDRNKEIRLHKMLSDHGLAPSLLVRFPNGHGYQFLNGTVCSAEDMTTKRVWANVAREMARWHATLPAVELDTPERIINFEPSIWSTTRKWLNALSTDTDAQRKRLALLEEEFAYCVNNLTRNDGPTYSMVLGHADLLSGNIVLQTQDAETVDGDMDKIPARFIDYEHSTYCPRAFELANHFAEWAGFECKYELLPTTSTRLGFVREYLQAYEDIKEQQRGTSGLARLPVSDAQVNRLMSEIDSFRGFPGFYWGLCALIQAEASTGAIDFDYAGYAEKRFSEYWAWREMYRGGSSKTASAREENWASL
ncbi:related to ethanolamine kinase [Ramularia collo-cygni]|uniref:ethanolamine kinase n=1 Tax=Ramularia collo-cygni TaxID=112498 RepID=A0A2D3V7B0_9PEZI|nr:related to ethanolamine kinase [Ramularia collo-cygni]CZT19456.1 related to ethanolamine kinase [Ramularia collo-cygni]